MNENPSPSATPTETPVPVPAPGPIPFRVIGVGNAGVNAVESLPAAGFPATSIVAVNWDERSLTATSAGEKICLTPKCAPAAGGDLDLVRKSAEDQADKWKSLFAATPTVMLVTGLGGNCGTGASPVIAAAAREAGAFVLSVVILPFDCEGTARTNTAQLGIERLSENVDLIIYYSNQKALPMLGEGTGMRDAFKASDQFLVSALRLACRAIGCETVMGSSFAELCRQLRRHSADCVLAVAEASGPNRAGELCEKLWAHPALGNGTAFAEAAVVAACVCGGPSLSMSEVNRIMEEINRQAGRAPVLMGACHDPSMTDTVSLALLAGRADEDVAPMESPSRHKGGSTDLSSHLLGEGGPQRASRFVPPPPNLSQAAMEQMRAKHGRAGRKSLPRLRQTQLPLEIVSKGRFDKSEPTIHKGEDLDVPTYIRRGVSLN